MRLPSKRPSGFTLIEILVAISIAAVLVAVAGFSLRSVDRGLQTDTDRLALLLSLAREEAQLRGAPIRFESDDSAYWFVIRTGEGWEPILDDPDLREREWGAITDIELVRDDGRDELIFGRDMVDSPFELRLIRGDKSATITANGLGVFEAER